MLDIELQYQQNQVRHVTDKQTKPKLLFPTLPFRVVSPRLTRTTGTVLRSSYAIYTYLGSDLPAVARTGFPLNNVFYGNHIKGGPQAIKIKQASGTQIVNNNFSEPMKIEWQNSTGNVVVGNEGLHDNSTEVRLYDTCFDVTDEEVLAKDEC